MDDASAPWCWKSPAGGEDLLVLFSWISMEPLCNCDPRLVWCAINRSFLRSILFTCSKCHDDRLFDAPFTWGKPGQGYVLKTDLPVGVVFEERP